MLTRLVRIVNVSIAVLVVLIAIAVYWYAFRPLPQTTGELSAPIGATASIKRDARGVPHIEAKSWQDAIFLQGYATAQDRLWQMDFLRRFGAGELAEIFGPGGALIADEQSRKMRMRAIAEANVRRLTPEDRLVLVEYARGVNYFINTHRGDYSLEFALPGHAYDPRPWTLTDSMLVGLIMFRDLTDSSKYDYDKGVLLSQADPVKVQTLFPPAQGAMLSPGSNAWAVSGAHTADGKPIAANDPHLAYGIPGTWYLVHLQAPDLNVTGASLPGLPCVISGHNGQIAWGVTNMQVDVMDLYVEQMDSRTGRYVFAGKLEQAQLDQQMIGVRGQKPVEVDTWITRHGPIAIQENGRFYAMRWSATDGFGFPFWKINRAGNWEQFRAALSAFWGPGQNFIYADRAGNIGYQATGRFPIRGDGKTPVRSDAPLDGASGGAEWTGYIPFEQLPTLYNPPSGMIATANQNPFPPGFPYQMNGSFADRYRVRQIRALLGGQSKLTVNDMLRVQKDVYSAYDHFLAMQVIAAASRRSITSGAAREAVAVLRSWNGQMDKDEAAPMITALLSNEMGKALVTASMPRKMAGPSVPTILPRPQVIETLLRTRPKGWVANDDWDRWTMDNLSAALEAGRKQGGSPVSKWRWGRLLQWNPLNLVTTGFPPWLPFVKDFFNIGPVEMSGSGTTVKQTTATLGPSERMVVDLGNLDNSVQNLPVGESGMVASNHYKDQWPSYYVGNSFPMEFGRVDAKQVLRVKPGGP